MKLKSKGIIFLLLASHVFISCQKTETAIDILNQTINSIDTIESIHYKQDMVRSNPRQVDDTISGFREMYFQRLISDSIVGVKGHWYMYVDDKVNVIYEDIYDGERLIRKKNLDSTLRLHDLVKYPEFKHKPFWSHNTLYIMQHSFRHMLDNTDIFKIKRLNDTIFNNKSCFQIVVQLEDKMLRPGFESILEDSEGWVSRTIFRIDKLNYYPIGMNGEYSTSDKPGEKFFIDQTYYDIDFNVEIDEDIQFNTSDESFYGYQVNEIEP